MKTSFIRLSGMLVLIVLFTGCRNNRERDLENKLDRETREETTAETHAGARGTIAYEGTYTGTLPCADCDGIHTELTLQGNNYTMKRQYLDKMNSEVINDTGTFIWDGTGNVIILDMVDMPDKYMVSENQLTALDQNGNIVTGETAEHYILRKQ